jgi:hypothetical protein
MISSCGPLHVLPGDDAGAAAMFADVIGKAG